MDSTIPALIGRCFRGAKGDYGKEGLLAGASAGVSRRAKFSGSIGLAGALRGRCRRSFGFAFESLASSFSLNTTVCSTGVEIGLRSKTSDLGFDGRVIAPMVVGMASSWSSSASTVSKSCASESRDVDWPWTLAKRPMAASSHRCALRSLDEWQSGERVSLRQFAYSG